MKRLTVLFLISCFAIFFAFEAKAQTSDNNLYKVGTDDVIQIKVLDQPNLSLVTTISSDGSITFPHLGTVHIKGMSVPKIEEEITQRLSEGYVKYPVVTVSLVKSMSRTILTYGEIRHIGKIPFDDNMTIMRTMSIAGGVSEGGKHGRVKVKRKDGESGKYKDIIESQLDDGIIENKEVEETLLQPDDILIVERNKTFLIQGDVASRGRVVLERGMTVLSAILQAGGVFEEGRYGKIKVRRKQDGESGKYKDIIESQLDDGIIENKEVEETLLQPDDILIVERNKTFLIQGDVASRGRVVLERGMTVLSAILQAGGVLEEGRYGKIKVRRKQEGEIGKYKDVIESQLSAGVIEKKEVEDMLLQPDDVLIVERNKTFFIYGEVNKTGEFLLDTDMTVFKAITLAGGFTKWGSGSRVKILRPKNNHSGLETIKVNIEDVLAGDASADVHLMPEDIIVVSTGIF